MDQGHSLARFLLPPVGTVDVGKSRLLFWDLGGQEELQSLWDKVIRMPCTACPSGHLSPGGTPGPLPLSPPEASASLSFPPVSSSLHPLCS